MRIINTFAMLFEVTEAGVVELDNDVRGGMRI
jgi:hypothetical protein